MDLDYNLHEEEDDDEIVEMNYCPFCEYEDFEEVTKEVENKYIEYYCSDCGSYFNNKDSYQNCKKIVVGYSSHGCERENCPYKNTSTCQMCDGD